MKLYLVLDNTAGNINKLCNAKGLIAYANEAHFIGDEIPPAKTIDDAIEILKTDMFHVEELSIKDDEVYILDLERS